MRPLRLALLVLTLAGPVACKSAGGSTASSSSSRSNVRNPDVIAGDEIQAGIASGLGNAYDLVSRLHPNWMRSVSRMEVQVWVDGQRYGGVTTLRSVLLTAVVSIRYLSPSEAQGQLGLDNQGGAIVVAMGK